LRELKTAVIRKTLKYRANADKEKEVRFEKSCPLLPVASISGLGETNINPFYDDATTIMPTSALTKLRQYLFPCNTTP
jgi:hypothetical protein